MTIEYLDSKRIVKLSTENLGLSFEDDFSTDNWTDNGATTHVTGGSLVWNSDTTDNGCSLDMLGSTISDTAWVARFKFTVTNFDSGTGNHQFQFLVSDKANLDVTTTSRDSLGFKIIKATSDEYALAWKNGGTISTNIEVAFSHSAQAETIYVEMSRLSSTSFKVEFFSDSSYTTSIESETATISNVVDLRYLIAIEQDINGSATMNGTIDDFEFYNGVTSISNKPTNVQDNSILVEKDTGRRYWFSEALAPTFEDDFDYANQSAADAVWVPNTTNIDVNISTDVLDINNVGTLTSNISCVCDLGTISDTKWVLRYKVNWSTLSVGERYAQTFVGLSDKNGTVAWDGSQDSISVLYNRWGLFKQQNSVAASMQDWLLGSDMTDMSVSTDYYVETIRDGTSVSYTAYSDSDYSVPVSGISGTVTLNGNPTGLQYFVIRNDTTSGTGTTAGIIDDFEFYNGVTSATPATWSLEGLEKFYDTTATASNADLIMQVASSGHGTRVGVKILAGSPAIGKYVQNIKFKLSKITSPSGNYQITVRDSSDTVKATANFSATGLPTSATIVDHDIGSPVKLAEGDRILFEYGGASGTKFWYNNSSGVSGFAMTYYNYSSAYVDDSTDQVIGAMDSQQ